MVSGPKRLDKWIAYSSLALALMLVLYLAAQRMLVYEQQLRQVEIAFPESALIQATLKDPQAPAELQGAGVTTLVRKPYTLKSLIDFHLARAWLVSPRVLKVELADHELSGKAILFLTGQLGMNAVSMKIKDDGYQLEIDLPGPVKDLDPTRYIMAVSSGPMPAGFRRALYLPAGDWGRTNNLDQFTQAIYSLKPDLVIPDWKGGANAGAFYRSYLHTPWLRKPLMALPEFGLPWQGKWALRNQHSHYLVRAHLLQADDMEGLSPAAFRQRLLRAVNERNVNLVVVDQPASWSFNRMLAALRTFKASLQAQGIRIGAATRPRMVRIGQVAVAIIYLGISALLFLVIWQVALWMAGVTSRQSSADNTLVIRLKPANFRWSALFFLMALLILQWQGEGNWAAKMGALSLAILAPFFSLTALDQDKPDVRSSRAVWITPLKTFFKITGINLLAGLTIAVLLYQPAFTLRIDTFFGVKAALALPLFLGTIYLLPSLTDGTWWKKRWSRGHWPGTALTLLFLAALLSYALLRSGNQHWMPVSTWEYWLRDHLEAWLPARPRFKELLIGHPLLLLGLVGYYRLNHRQAVWPKVCIALGMIGQVSLINTFCHIHTPLLISLWRTVLGVVLGLALGNLMMVSMLLLRPRRG